MQYLQSLTSKKDTNSFITDEYKPNNGIIACINFNTLLSLLLLKIQFKTLKMVQFWLNPAPNTLEKWFDFIKSSPIAHQLSI